MSQENLRCAAIHDLSGLGKCSLTVALPILSAMGVETSVLPTAVLSNHTAFSDFTYRDLTDDIMGFAEQWKREGAAFEALYSGFLGSERQIKLISRIFDLFRTGDNLILVDPVMGDNGKLYKTYTKEMAMGVCELCKKADIIVPNLTEAAYITGKEYREGPYDRAYIEALLLELSQKVDANVVLTGVWFCPEELGSAAFERSTGRVEYSLLNRYPGYFHGTGDIFGSVLLGAVLRGRTIFEAQAMACEFVGKAIAATLREARNPNFGVCFEQCLPGLMEKLREKS